MSECFVPNIVYSTTFGYRTDLVETPPTALADVFDLEKIPGKRSLEKKPIGNLEWALIADGVPAADVYDLLSTPEGVERAFAKLDTIKSEVVWWVKGAVPVQLLADGEVVIASAYNGRLFAGIEEDKQPIAMLWDWQVFDIDGWVIPKGTPKYDEVVKLLRFATDTQRLADSGEVHLVRPGPEVVRPDGGQARRARELDMAPHMPTNPENAKNTLLFNYEWWADHRDELDERFNAWLARS